VANLPDLVKAMRREGWIIEQKLVLYAAAMRQAPSLNISVGKPSLVVKRVRYAPLRRDEDDRSFSCA